jgi:hypothetical protein
MKKTIVMLAGILFLSGCVKDDFAPNIEQNVAPELKMANSVGIKLQSAFVTSEVAMNVKIQAAGTVTIKIFDIANRVVSKETVNVKEGDNILKVYTTALPSSAYRVGLFDSANNMLGITDFNKIN